jgi:phage repressor protein C with HTH and peptisase S24 domain
MAIGKTIRILRKARRYTLNQLATMIESDVGNLSRLERGVQGYTEATLEKIAAALEVPVGALFVGSETEAEAIAELVARGVTLREGYDFRAVHIPHDSDDRFVQVPLVKPRLSAGIMGIQVDPEYDEGRTTPVSREWVDKNRFNLRNLIAIKVRGESMEPTLHEGDTVVINTADMKPVDGVVFAVNYEGEAVVKRLSRDAGQWWLTSDNVDQRKYHRKICQGDACLIIGRVVRKESDRI